MNNDLFAKFIVFISVLSLFVGVVLGIDWICNDLIKKNTYVYEQNVKVNTKEVYIFNGKTSDYEHYLTYVHNGEQKIIINYNQYSKIKKNKSYDLKIRIITYWFLPTDKILSSYKMR